jgi:hypothetical protein
LFANISHICGLFNDVNISTKLYGGTSQKTLFLGFDIVNIQGCDAVESGFLILLYSLLNICSALKIEALHSSKMTVEFLQTTRCHIPEGSSLEKNVL